jgi:hypothetical protein
MKSLAEIKTEVTRLVHILGASTHDLGEAAKSIAFLKGRHTTMNTRRGVRRNAKSNET